MKKLHVSSVLRISLAYLLLGALWILFPEKIITPLSIGSDGYSTAHAIGDYIFIIATSVILFLSLKDSKSASKTSGNNLSDVFEFATVGIFQSSPEGKYIKVNPMMASIYGYGSPEEMLNKINDISRQIHISVENRRRFTEILDTYGAVDKFEAKNLKKDGTVIWTSTNARAVRDQNGGVLYYEGFITDITSQKNSENALRNAEKQSRTLIEQIPVAAYTESKDGFVNFFSSLQIFTISGYTAEEWNKNPDLWMNIIHPDDTEKVKEENERTLLSGESFNAEYRLITKDGRTIWIHDVATAVKDENNSLLHWQGILVDVTREKMAEEQIKTSEAQYRMVVEHASDGIIVIGMDGKLIEANQQICNLLGYTRGELLSLTLNDLTSNDELQAWDINEITRGRVTVIEKPLKRKDGTLLLVELSLKILPNQMLIGIARNISNRRLMEESLARSEKKFRALIENSMDAVALYSAEGKILFQSPAASHILGYPSSEMIGRSVLDFVHQDDRQKAYDAIQKIINHPNEGIEFIIRCVRKDGNIKWIEFNGTNHLNEKDIEAIISNFRDITERKIYENALFEAEERYRLLVENLPAVIFMDKFDDNQTTQYISPRIKDLLGYTADEWAERDDLWENSLHPDDKERVIAEDIRTNETGEPFRIEYRMRHRQGHYVWIKEDASIVKGENGTPLFWQGVLLDITEQKQIEETLKRRDAILKTVGFSAEQFLKTTDWEKSIRKVLAQLGEATSLSRIYIFKKEQKTDQTIPVSLVYEWRDVNWEPRGNHHNPIKIDLENDGLSRWAEYFDQGRALFGNIIDLPPQEREFLQNQDILSIICIPIQVGADWWGFIRLDECKIEREWSEVEVEALRAAANTLGTSIERKISEEALQNSEASYRGLFNTVQDAIYIQDKNGHFLDVNDGAVQMYGYSKEYFIGKTPEFLSAPGKNDLRKVAQAIQLAFEGKPQQFEFWGLRSNGEIFPKDVRLFKGSYFGQEAIIAVSQDITSRKENEEALQKQFRELSILHSVALTESTARDSDQLIQQITDIIGDALYSDNCGVLLLNEAKDTLIPHFSYRGTDIEKVGASLPVTKGISGRVVSTRRSIRTGDVSLEPSYFEITSNTRSELCVPIISRSIIFGVLNVESRKLNTFSERDERLLNTIAGGLANALERIQLFEAEKKRRMEAEILREATLELTSNFELDKLFENIFASLAKLISYDSASIELIDQGYIEIVAAKNIPEEMIGYKYKADLVRWSGLESFREAKIIDNVQLDERFVKFDQTSYIRGWMGIPLLAKDKIIGFLNLDSRTAGFFNSDHAAIAQTFANQAAIAIENTRLFKLEQNRRKEAEILSLATSSLANMLNIDDLFENILDWLKKLAPYDSASILLKQRDGSLKLAAKRNLSEQYQIGQNFQMSHKWMEVAQSLKPLVLEDAQKDDRFEKWAGTEYIHGWMAVAIVSQDSLLGFINLDSRTPGIYTEEHATLIQTFANQAATAIEKARLFELEKKRRESAETLMHAATELTNLLDLPSLHNAILDWLYKIAPYDSASILEIEGDHVRITAAKGLPNPEKALDQTYSSNNTLCKTINETGQALIIDDCMEDSRFEKWGDSQHVRGWMGVPLISRGQVIGYLTVDSRSPNAFNQDDAVAAQTFAHQAATSLENTRLYTETRRRLEELEMVNRVSFALRAAKDTKEMLPILLDEIKSSIETDTAAIWLYDLENDQLIPQAISGWLENLPKPAFKPDEGIIGKVFSDGLPRLSPELSRDLTPATEYLSFYKDNWSGLTVPIRTSSDTIGVIMIARQIPLRIESHHVRLITTLADIAGNAIYRSSLFQKNEEQIRRLTTLREMDTSITSSLDLHITLGILTEHLTSKMDVSAARILVYNPNSQMLDSFTAIGFNNPVSPRHSISISDGLTSQILLSRRELYIKNIGDEADLFPESLSAENFKSYYAIPLFSKGSTRGVIETYFRDTFTPTTDWKDFLKTLAGQATIAIDNAQLFENLQRSNQELSLAYDTTLEGWGKALELRDKETQGHTQRVTNLTLELARQIGILESEITHIRRGALLHDIGKMGVPDSILHKPGALTDEEIAEMRKHPQYAYDLLSPIAYLRPTLDIAYCHHEWWDGNGYPRGLKGEEIPLSARIFAIIDVWDALLSDRPYRDAWPEADVIKYITGLSGKQFDPHIVSEFQKMIKAKLPKIAQKVSKKNPAKQKKTTAKTKKKR